MGIEVFHYKRVTKMLTHIKYSFIIIIYILIVGCSGSIESKVIGKWEKSSSLKASSSEIILKPNGKALLLTRYKDKLLIDTFKTDTEARELQWSLKEGNIIIEAEVHSILHIDDKTMVLKLTGYTHTEGEKQKIYSEYIKASAGNETFLDFWNSRLGTISEYKRLSD